MYALVHLITMGIYDPELRKDKPQAQENDIII